MSLGSFLTARAMAWYSGAARERARHVRAERRRRRSGDPHRIEFFHEPGEPHSELMRLALERLGARHHVEIVEHVIGAPSDWAIPERELHRDWASRDAQRLARRAGIDLALAARQRPPDADCSASSARRDRLGHFLSGVAWYGNDWYASIDRLHFLDDRLVALGARRQGDQTPPPWRESPFDPSRAVVASCGISLQFYLSFRSPYTAVAAPRVVDLARRYGAQLELRYLLPMVMRSLPVPRRKALAFVQDAAREARYHGIPFGRIADPVGRPVERGYALMPWALAQGRGTDFVLAFLDGVWAKGIDAGSDRGLKKIVERAGLAWTAGRRELGNPAWRAEAEANAKELRALGLWGVPAFRVGNEVTWGQDRLWFVEAALRDAASCATPVD
ncbi:MAG: DsbA family protein [Pseudomonadales bacterium]